MKNQWIEYYRGVVTVKASGKGIERFLNSLTRESIHIWNVRSHGTSAISFQMNLRDAKRIRTFARDSDCKLEFQQREGIPFLTKRMLKNSGFVIGAILFFTIITLLSNMVWGIEIKGANPATQYKIEKELEDMGVKRGKLQFFIDNVEAIQKGLTNNVKEITWVGVELKGTTYHLQVVEKNEPEKIEALGPQHLIAKKKAIIENMFVEEGQPVVSIHDRVVPGQLLVSGLVGNEEEPEVVSARGEVFGETWYKSTVSLPLNSTFQVFNGNEKEKHYLEIGSLKIPIWGYGKMEFKEHEKEENQKSLRFLSWELPISYKNETFRERETITRSYTDKEAVEVAKEMARQDIKSLLDDNAKIKGEKVLHQSADNGKVTLSIHFQIIENIAQGQPFTQGDAE